MNSLCLASESEWGETTARLRRQKKEGVIQNSGKYLKAVVACIITTEFAWTENIENIPG
jgi:hypothetical protein